MGTNFYWLDGKKPCPTCGHEKAEELHIGKSSGGWVFALCVHPDKGINTLYDWIEAFLDPDSRIRNEYGDKIGVDAMLRTIMRRKGKADDQSMGWYAENHARPGPNGLARSNYGNTSAGEGTWDYHTGNFS